MWGCFINCKIKICIMKYFQIFVFLILSFLSSVTYSQNVAVEVSQSNISWYRFEKVLYLGIDNELNIAVENYSCDDLVVKAINGKITKTPDKCHYIYRINKCDTIDEISVGVNKNGKIEWIYACYYLIKLAPRPIVTVDGRSEGEMPTNSFVSADKLDLTFYNPGYYSTSIREYSVEIIRNDSIVFGEYNIFGRVFTSKFINEIKKSYAGDEIKFSKILLIKNGCKSKYKDIEFTIKSE